MSDVSVDDQLIGLGESGIAALVDVYQRLEPANAMRGQLATYTLVRQRLKMT